MLPLGLVGVVMSAMGSSDEQPVHIVMAAVSIAKTVIFLILLIVLIIISVAKVERSVQTHNFIQRTPLFIQPTDTRCAVKCYFLTAFFCEKCCSRATIMLSLHRESFKY
jgi:hypothetical protein